MRSSSGKPSPSSAKQFRRVTLPHVGSSENEGRVRNEQWWKSDEEAFPEPQGGGRQGEPG